MVSGGLKVDVLGWLLPGAKNCYVNNGEHLLCIAKSQGETTSITVLLESQKCH